MTFPVRPCRVLSPPQRVVPLARRHPGGGVSFCRYRRDGMKLPHPELGRNCATALARVLRLLCTELPGLAKTGVPGVICGRSELRRLRCFAGGGSCGHATGRCQPYGCCHGAASAISIIGVFPLGSASRAGQSSAAAIRRAAACRLGGLPRFVGAACIYHRLLSVGGCSVVGRMVLTSGGGVHFHSRW